MEDIISKIAEPAFAILLVLLNAFVVFLTNWLRQMIKSKTATDALSKVMTITETVVVSLNQEIVEALKNDGRFDKKEQFQIKEKAMAEIKRQLPDFVLSNVQGFVTDIDAFISKHIEKVVVDSKK